MKCFLPLFFAVCFSFSSFAQTDTLEMIGDEAPKKEVDNYRLNIFNSTRTINGHAAEFLPKGYLDFRILHRFGTVKNGFKDLLGLDFAAMRLGLDYGITNGTTVGIGRSTFRKELDIYVKQKLYENKDGMNPLQAFAVVGAARTTGITFDDNSLQIQGANRNAYFAQIGIGTLIKNKIGLQITPTILQNNLVENTLNKKTVVSVGIAGRYKIKKHLSFVVDYFANVSGLNKSIYKNPLSLGFDIETGGHVFQLHFSNANGMNERAFITQTKSQWGKTEFRFGFNLSRLFQIKK